MKAKKSILKLEFVSILKSICESHPFEDYPNNILEYMQDYDIEIDYDILTAEKDSNLEEDTHFISVKIEVNKEKKPGYYLFVETTGIFSLPQDADIKDEDRASLILSGVNMCITNLRGYITNLTSYCPYGQYVLPAIDMNNLLDQKRDLMKSTEIKD